MNKLKYLIEQATRKTEMRWRVFAYDPDKDNALVGTPKTYDCICGASAAKMEILKDHPNYIVEIIAESIQKNEGELKYFTYTKDKLKTKADVDKALLGMKKALAEEPNFDAKRAIQKDMEIVKSWKSQKNETVTKSNYKSIINDLEAVFKKFAGGDLKLEHKKKPNSFDLPLDTCLSVPLKDKAKLEPVKAALKKVINKYGARKVAHKDDFAYNFGETNKDGIYVGWNWNADRAFLGYAVNPDFDVKYLSEAAKYKVNGTYWSADGQDKFKINAISGDIYKVTYDDGTKASLTEKEIEKWITGEAANIDVKNPGMLEVPDGKNVQDLPQSHFEKLVDKKGYAEVIRALTNLEVWNKDKNKSLSSWASSMADKLKKKYRPESAQKNEALNLDKLTDADAKQLIIHLNDFIKDKASKYYHIDKIEDILKKKYKAESAQKNEDEDDMVDVVDKNGNIEFIPLDDYLKNKSYYDNNLTKYAKKQSSIKQKQQSLDKLNALTKEIKKKEQELRGSYGSIAYALDKELSKLNSERDRLLMSLYGKTFSQLHK